MTANRCSPAFADYLLEVAIRYPQAETIHLVLDNLSSHTRRAVVQRFGEKAGGWLWVAAMLVGVLVLRPLDYVTKLVSGVLACELPLDGNPVAIHTTISGPGLLAQASDVSDSAFA